MSILKRKDKKAKKDIAASKKEGRKTKPIEVIPKDEKDNIYAFCYRLLGRRIQFLYPKFTNIEKSLKSAMMMVPYEAYVSTIIFFSIIGGIAGVAAGVVFSLLVEIHPEAFKILLPLILGIVGSQVTFVMVNRYPSVMVSTRKSRINDELPYFIGYMATLAASSLSLEMIFRTISEETDSDEELVKDSRFIMRNIDALGMDIISGLKDLVERSSNVSYAELLEGLIATVQSGGDLSAFFQTAAKVHLEEKKMSLRKMISSLGMVAEMYTILLVVFPLMGIVILSIMAIMTPSLGGFSLTNLMYLITFGFVPVIGIMMLFMIESMVPKK